MTQAIVAADEYVLRRLHKNHVNPGPPLTVVFVGFRPNQADTAGISVYREKLVSAEILAASGRKPGEYYVARLRVADLQQYGLTVVVDELPEGPTGHALIPELSFDACEREKARWRDVLDELAELAREAIVYSPVK